MGHFVIYLWFRVGGETFADHNKVGKSWQDAIALEVLGTTPGMSAHVDLG